MMKRWAYFVDGVLYEIIDDVIEVDGRAVPLSERYHPEFVEQLVPYVPPFEGGET